MVKSKKALVWTPDDLRVSDVLVHERLGTVHLGIVTPGNQQTPLQVVYARYKNYVTEVPINQTYMHFRWVFRFPGQEAA
jgi:hypothetical protein